MTRGDLIWITLMKLGHIYGCHQIPERSFTVSNRQFPVCARCTGILVGQIAGLIMFVMRINLPWYLVVLFFCIMLIDWSLQFFKVLMSTNIRRFISGTLCGIGLISTYVWVVKSVITLIGKIL